MGAITAIALTELRRRLGQPVPLAIWIGVPVMLALLMAAMGLAGGSQAPIATVLLADPGASITGALLRGAAGRQSRLVVEPVDEADGRNRQEAGEATALLVLPPDIDRAFLDEKQATLDLTLHPGQKILPGVVHELTDALLDTAWYTRRLLAEPIDRIRDLEHPGLSDIALIFPAIERLTEAYLPPLLELEITETTAALPAKVRFGTVIVPGLLVMTLLLAAGGIADDLWLEREGGTLARYLAGPGSVDTFLLGKLTGAAILMLALSAAGIAAAALIADRGWRGTGWACGLLALVGLLFVVLDMVVQTYASSRRTGTVLTTALTFPLMMIGGSFFPLDELPGAIGIAGRWTPNGRVLMAVEDVLMDRADLVANLVLTTVLAACVALAGLTLKRRLQRIIVGD